jgi:2-succinyl-5-enolpyruvyl-6-hydroxy-3-cyclohexene-1-carboxylate synthase
VSVQATFSATLVDEWVRCGVTEAVICPGSRSTPLALALAARLRGHVRLDERSAGFYALGLAQATGRPTVICVTSGTAAAELHPAVVEAHHARVPLIVCTADRPPELLDTGAPQTIDQVGLFTTATRWSSNPGVPTAEQQPVWRPLAARAYEEAVRGPSGPGPVHLNLAFREPLTGTPDALPDRPGPKAVPGVRRPRPALDFAPLQGNGMIVAGGLSPAAPDPARVHELAEHLSWPVLADPRSGSRRPGTIAAADAIVRTEPPLPETVVLLGSPWLSKALNAYVSEAAEKGARVIVLDPWHQWTDPTRVATEFLQCDPDEWLAAAIDSAKPADPAWLKSWRAMEDAAQAAIEDALALDLSEPQVARLLYAHAANRNATIVVSASMPIRDLEWYGAPQPAPPRVLANRGANGIDGIVSTALGVAAATSNPRSESSSSTFALLGDLAFLHDVSGLVNIDPAARCTFVVVDNGGGGIFSFLPQADALEPEIFESLFGTPPRSDIGAVARGFGLTVHEVTTTDEFKAALDNAHPAVIHVRVPGRADNVARHEAINQAVRRALG